jgi:hypothetical protein
VARYEHKYLHSAAFTCGRRTQDARGWRYHRPGGDSSGQSLRNAANRARARSPVSPLPARDRALRRRPAGLSRWARCFVRTIDIGSLSTMTLSRSKITRSTSLLIRIALSKFLGPISNQVLEFLAENLLRTLDADAPLLLGALVARPKNRDSLPITIQSLASGRAPGRPPAPRAFRGQGGPLSRRRRQHQGFRRSPGSAPSRRSGRGRSARG